MAPARTADKMPVAPSHQSIRGKLTRIILISCRLAVVSACTLFAGYDIRVAGQSRLRAVATLAEITGTNSTAALTFSDEQAGREILRSLRADKQLTHAALYTTAGKVLAVAGWFLKRKLEKMFAYRHRVTAEAFAGKG